MRQEAEAIRRSAARKLPFDLDQKLSPELGKMARLTDAMADELEKLQKQVDLLNKDAANRLEKMIKRLDAGRSDYRGTMEAIEHLEAIFPLLVDQERFTVLVLRQQDLAERMASLRGHDGEDNPALKARMRDLEEEQRQIRLALEELLGDIEDHATRLPDKAELRKLRETALKFAKDVRASGAGEAMTAAENVVGRVRRHARPGESQGSRRDPATFSQTLRRHGRRVPRRAGLPTRVES